MMLGRGACCAGTAGGRDPFDADAVADFAFAVFGAWTHLYDLADALVAADLTLLRRMWQAHPAVGHNAHVRVAYSRVRAKLARSAHASTPASISKYVQVDEHLARTRLGRVKLGHFGANFARL